MDAAHSGRAPRSPASITAFAVQRADGTEEVDRPANPLRAPGRVRREVGARSCRATRRRPGWRPSGTRGHDERARRPHARARRRGHGAPVEPRRRATPDEPLPLLVANDGPEYDELAGLTDYAAAMIAAGRSAARVALLAPGDRDEWYSASAPTPRAARATCLPASCRDRRGAGPPVGMGASLGGLAMLHAQRRYPGRVRRPVPAVRQLLHAAARRAGVRLPALPADRRGSPRRRARAGRSPDPVPVVLTCGARRGEPPTTTA